MKKFFKKLFTTAINRATEEDLDKLPKTRVLPFTKTANPWYFPQYFHNGRWKRFTKNCTRYDSLSLWSNNQPYLFKYFDDAVDFCKQWNSLREIVDNRAFLDKEYENEVQNFKKQIDAEQKTWYSES